MFIIGGIQKVTLVDFPEKVAAIVFTQGCNFRCGYCHNPELLEYKNNSKFKTSDFFDFLKTRTGKLDGVVITGGEPTIQNDLYDFIKEVKSLGFLIKLDTNGTNPVVLKNLINENLIDYIAMDIKAPLEKYSNITGLNCNLESIRQSINIIITSNIDHEFRTTIIKSQLSYEDFDKIGKLISGAKQYYLQKFVPTKIYNKSLMNEVTYSDIELERICKNLKNYIKIVKYR